VCCGVFLSGIGWYGGALHVAGVAHTTVSSLRGALVEAHLQVELTLVGTELLLGEAALVLVGHLGSQCGASVLGVLLRLRIGKKLFRLF